MALTRAKLMELIDNGDIDVGGGGFSPNILHNWDFRNPVNQRGVSGAISTGTYFYDRWIRVSGTVTTNAAYLTIGAGAVIEQRIEGHLLAGAVVTVSVMVGGTVYSGTGTMPTSAGTASVTLTGWGAATLGYATGYMYVRLSPTAASNVQRAKLELGTVSTLAYDPPMDHAVELPKCLRFGEVLLSNESGGTAALATGMLTTATQIMVPLRYASKRIAPTITLEMSDLVVRTSGGFNASIVNVQMMSAEITQAMILLDIQTHAYHQVGQAAVLRSVGAKGRIFIDSNL